MGRRVRLRRASGRGPTADKRQGMWTGAACVFLPVVGGGHGARCIEYAILGVLSRRSILPDCADAGGGGGWLPHTRGCMGGSSEPAWVAAAAWAVPPPASRRGFPTRSRVSGKRAAGWLCFSPEPVQCCSTGCSPELTYVGACSVRFVGLGADLRAAASRTSGQINLGRN